METQGQDKQCSKCGAVKNIDDFDRRNRYSEVRRAACKGCYKSYSRDFKAQYLKHKDAAAAWRKAHPAKVKKLNKRYKKAHPDRIRANTAKRRADKLLRTPKWAELPEIREFYANCPAGHHVDHIIPLCGREVSGLHVLSNLQYLPARVNERKGNKFNALSQNLNF